MFCFLFGHKYEFVEIKKKYWACCSRCGQLREMQTGGLTKREAGGGKPRLFIDNPATKRDQ